MKKTLAAVLAAMMALSTATVALAKDTDVAGDVDSVLGVLDTTSADITGVEYGTKPNFTLNVAGYTDELGAALKAGEVKVDVTVTDGRSLLAAAPTVKVYKDAKDPSTYKDDLYYAVLGLNIKDTFNTDIEVKDGAIALRVRVTALKDGVLGMTKKGDTLSVDEILFDPFYKEITAYGKDMTITAEEVKSNNVVVEMDGLRDALEAKDTETATFYFGDVAAFTTKISEAQKDVNVHYETKVSDDYYEEYPELSFEAIQFQGTPKFLRKGTLTFNAIGDEDTVVYEVLGDGEYAILEIAEYDSTYDVVTVEGINTLTSYLVASEAIFEEEAEVEEPAVEEENPNTGAC